MSRGAIAKQVVEDKIREAFGKDFVGVDPSTKKIYVQAEESGEMVQISISMTCPKVPFSVDGDGFAGGNFGEPDVFQPAEISIAEMDNVHKLIKEFKL